MRRRESVKIFKTKKTVEIQLVRLTEVCGKILSEKNGYKSVKTAMLLMWTTKTAVCLQTKAIFHQLYGVFGGVLAKFQE